MSYQNAGGACVRVALAYPNGLETRPLRRHCFAGPAKSGYTMVLRFIAQKGTRLINSVYHPL
jgi:hypothetical protein